MHPLVRRYAPHSVQWFGRYWKNRIQGHFEREMRTFVGYCRAGSVAVDAGANIGFFSYALSRRGARVHAFEPVPECAAVVRTIHGVTVHQHALSDRAGSVTLYVPTQEGIAVNGLASLLPRDGPHTRVPVTTVTLDSFHLTDVSVIKVDVEGHELAVLAGAQQTIAREHPVLLVEIEQRHTGKPVLESIAAIEAMGYRAVFMNARHEWQAATDFVAELHGDADSASYVFNFLFRPAGVI